MELVIKIDEGLYEAYKGRPPMLGDAGMDMIAQAIANGTPLPKRHGRLIEEPTETDISNTVGGNNDFAECIRDSVKAVFENAKTIVEADKESGNLPSCNNCVHNGELASTGNCIKCSGFDRYERSRR